MTMPMSIQRDAKIEDSSQRIVLAVYLFFLLILEGCF